MSAPSSRAQKDKRNARERRLVASKKNSMERMRMQLEHLELEKQQLSEQWRQTAAAASRNETETLLTETESLLTETRATQAAAPTSSSRRRYLDSIAQVEHLRRENRSLVAQVYRHTLVRDAVEDAVEQDQKYGQDDDDGDDSSGSDAPSRKLLQTQNPLNLSLHHACILGQMLCAQIDAMQQDLDSWQHFSEFELFGWSDLRGRMSTQMEFCVQKVIPHETALSLWDKTWRAYTTPTSMLRIGPGFYGPQPVVHLFGDGVAAVEGCIESPMLPGQLFHARERSIDGCRAAIGVAAVNFETMRTQAISRKPFEFLSFYVFEDMARESSDAVPRVKVRFVSMNPKYPEAMARAVMAEIAFGVVRWETICVRPVLLVAQDEPIVHSERV